MLFPIGKDLFKKLCKTHPSCIKPLDLSFGLEAMCQVYTGELRGFMEERRELLAGEAERDQEDLVIHAQDIYDFEYLIESIKTNLSICCAGSGCSSGSVPSKVQETKDAQMETKEDTEKEGNKSGGNSPGVTDLAPLPISEGEKSGGNILTTEIVEKSPESGNLTKAQPVGNSVKASTPNFRPFVVMESVKETINQGLIGIKDQLIKELGGGRRPAIRTKDGKQMAPCIYGQDTKHGLMVLPQSKENSFVSLRL